MRFFFLILATIQILIFANPIPDDSSWDLNTVADLDIDAGNDPLGSNFSPDEVIIAGSIAIPVPRCTSDASTDKDLADVSIDNDLESKIQKRLNTESSCPNPIDPITPQSLPQSPSNAPKKATSNENNPCGLEYSKYLSCGGWEVTNPPIDPIFSIVLNCVEGTFYKILFNFEYKSHLILDFSGC